MLTYCLCSLMCERCVGSSVGHFGVITQQPLRNRMANRQCLRLSVSRPISQNREERKRGCDLAKMLLQNSGCIFQFKRALPRSPLPARVSGDTATGQKQLLHKDTPSNYFQWQHTIWSPMKRVKLHECKTSSSSRKQLSTASFYSNTTFKKHKGCACTEASLRQRKISVGPLQLQDWMHSLSFQTRNKARSEH